MVNVTFLEEGTEWRRIVINGCPSNYIISAKGIVYNTKRKMVMKPLKKNKTPKVLRKRTTDYLGFRLSVNGKYYDLLLHRLVALVFIPIPDNLINDGYTADTLEIDHLDCNKSNNDVLNLEWVTPQENMRRMYTNHLDRHCSCTDHGNCSYTDAQIHRVCSLLETSQLTMTEISRVTNVPYKTVSKIKTGTAFKDISKDYKISNFSKSIRSYNDDAIETALRMKLEFPKMPIQKISKETGINYQTLKNIFQRRIHVELYDKVFSEGG